VKAKHTSSKSIVLSSWVSKKIFQTTKIKSIYQLVQELKYNYLKQLELDLLMTQLSKDLEQNHVTRRLPHLLVVMHFLVGHHLLCLYITIAIAIHDKNIIANLLSITLTSRSFCAMSPSLIGWLVNIKNYIRVCLMIGVSCMTT